MIAGRRYSFSSRTGNKEAAAKIAARVYSDFVELGTDAALKKHRAPSGDEKPLTLGAWIERAEKVFAGSPHSFGIYARSARKIAADILGLRRDSKRFARKGGGYAAAANAAPLTTFTAAAIQEWRLAYVAARSANPAEAKAARVSCNSLLRNARALFSPDICEFLPKFEGEIPFRDAKFYPAESMRYQSRIDSGVLLNRAARDLLPANPEAYKVLLLGLCCGLRRGEIDRLLWSSVDLNAGVLHVEVTEAGGLKTADSAGEIDLDAGLVAVLRGLKARSTSQFVIECEAKPGKVAKWGARYRCDAVFQFLIEWLKAAGVPGPRPLHLLRKEAGSMVATRDGIYAASRLLRHSGIALTAAVYADLKKRVAIPFGELTGEPESCIPFGSPEPEAKPAKPASARRQCNAV